MTQVNDEAEAYEELKKFVETKFKNFDYCIIVGIGKISKETSEVKGMGFSFSGITAKTPFGIVKAIISNILPQFQYLIGQYEVRPAAPIVQPQNGDRK